MNNLTRLWKFLLICFVVSISSLALADNSSIPVSGGGDDGFYIGIQAGTNKNSNVSDLNPLSMLSASSLYMRIIGGYQFNKYLAMETGYGVGANHGDEAVNALKAANIDILGKIILPVYQGFSFNFFAGLSLLEDYVSNNGSTMRPKFGWGVSYKLTPSLQVDCGVMNIIRSAPSPSISPPPPAYSLRTNIYTVGITYHFVDLYCGQFLC